MLLNNQWVTEEIEEDIKKQMTMKNTTTQNLWVAAKADIRAKFRTIQSTSRNRSHQIK